MTDALRVTETDGRVRFGIRVQPRASRTELAGLHGDALRVRLTAPPVENAANEELVPFLARAFAVSSRSVRIVAGAHARTKIVEIDGIDAATVRRLAGGV